MGGNVVKFTKNVGVTIDVGTKDLIGLKNQFVILVKDTGVGIKEDQKGRLFQPFVRVDSGGSSFTITFLAFLAG